MPNKLSKANHTPIRTCVICKKKNEKKRLLRFVIIDKEIIFDLNNKILSRGYYLCNHNECINKSKKWLKKQKRKIDARNKK